MPLYGLRYRPTVQLLLMTVTFKPGHITVLWRGHKYEERIAGYFKDGVRITLDELPMQVRYLMSTTAEDAEW